MIEKVIYFAGGCFWGTEHYMCQFPGVLDTAVGYANGNVHNPAYEQVYTDRTGHVECVKVTYDPEVISLAALCRLFFRSIDPLLLNRQGEDCGTRYRTGIYWTDEEDRRIVEDIYAEIQSRYKEVLAVEKCPLECFYHAEEYHQDYLYRNPEGYCHLSLDTLKFAKTYSLIINELRGLADEGEYSEDDRLLGVDLPSIRKVAESYINASYDVLEALLENEWHECRLCAMLMLKEKYNTEPDKAGNFYLANIAKLGNFRKLVSEQ